MKAGLKPYYDEETKQLASYAWPGGYPLFYLDEENNVLCPACASKPDMSTEVVAADVNWEDESLTCDDCSKHIVSAYGDDEDDEKGEQEDV